MTTSANRVHYKATTFTERVACGRIDDNLTHLSTSDDADAVTCRACLRAMEVTA